MHHKDQGSGLESRSFFGHLIIVSQSRHLHIKDALTHPALVTFKSRWFSKKDRQGRLARELEKSGSTVEDTGNRSACIIDGMSLVQRLKGDGKTFGEIGSVLNLALPEGGQSVQIDVVIPIQNAERCHCGSLSGRPLLWDTMLCSGDSF